MGKNKRRRARGINSGSSQFRVTPQLIVQVRRSQVSSSNRRPLGITAVTQQLRPPSLSSPLSSISRLLLLLLLLLHSVNTQHSEEFINVTPLSVRLNIEHFTTQGFIFGSLMSNFIPAKLKIFFF